MSAAYNGNTQNVKIKTATMKDFNFYYKTRCEYSSIYWACHSTLEKPLLKEWYADKLKNETREIGILYNNHKKIGYCYIDKREQMTVEISIGISEKYQKRGLGTPAITAICNYINKNYAAKQIICWILENNLASQKIFTKNHFIQTDEAKDQFIPFEGKTYLMRKYIHCA